MKRWIRMILSCSMIALLCACGANKEPFEIKSITWEEINTKREADERFLVMVIRDNCPYCKKAEEYINESKEEHPGYVLYQLDTTKYELYKESEEAKHLSAKTEEGQQFLEMAPGFFYTPTFYAFEDGDITECAIGFEPDTLRVNVWPHADVVIDFDQAQQEDIWDFIEAHG